MKHSHIKATCAFLIVLLLLCSCNIPRPISSPQSPQRVAVLFSSLAQMWQEAGGQVAITVGETIERGLVAEETPTVDSGAGKTINAELLLSLAPDLVICSADIPAQVETAALMEQAGIPTLLLHVETLSDYVAAIITMTEITGNREAAETAVAMQARATKMITESAPHLADTAVLFVRAGSSPSSTKAKGSDEHFAAAMLRDLKCINIADSAPLSLDDIGMEAILAADPDCIFFSLMGDREAARANIERLLQTEAWQSLSAVKGGRYFILDRALFHFKPCGKWDAAYRSLIDMLENTDVA